MSRASNIGRFGNQCFNHYATSILAEKFNLCMNYKQKNCVEELGLNLFNGINNYHPVDTQITDNNYLEYYNKESMETNFYCWDYCQSTKIALIIHDYLKKNSNIIISNNKYKEKYNNNNDCFIHIRLGDVSKWNPGLIYYDNILSKLNVNKIFISSDSPDDQIIKNILEKYKNSELYKKNEVDTILFASTNKYIILSNGTFSAIIGYLSFFSTVYYVRQTEKTCWNCFTPLNEMYNIFKDHTTLVSDFIEVDPDNLE